MVDYVDLSHEKLYLLRKLVNKIFSNFWKMRMVRLNRIITQPEKVQRQLFQKLIYSAKSTEWGRKYNFGSIKTFDDFRNQVPLQTYESLFPYIDKMMHGHSDVLWPGKISRYSKSSGTTNDKSKYLPISSENFRKCHIRGTYDTMNLFYNEHPQSQIFSGRNFLMSGSIAPFEEYSKTSIGDVSAMMIEKMPQIARPFFEPEIEVALMANWEEKLQKMVAVAIHPDIAPTVTMIGGVPTWVLVFFKQILEQTRKSNILEVWPNFELYIHGGVNIMPYKNELNRFLPSPKVSYREVYNASEGYFGTQLRDSDSHMLLLLDNGVYYEYLPIEEWQKENPKTISIEDVEIGKTYALVISTNSGLWRYQIGDAIQFTSLKPHKFRITGRTKQQLNVFGEEVMVQNTDEALARTCEQYQVEVRDYTVAPIFMKNDKQGGHEWAIEFDRKIPDLNAFSTDLDLNLQSLNSDYEAKRYKDMALKRLTIRAVPEGTFEFWLRLRGKYGNQNKVPRLSNERHFLNEILRLTNRERISQS